MTMVTEGIDCDCNYVVVVDIFAANKMCANLAWLVVEAEPYNVEILVSESQVNLGFLRCRLPVGRIRLDEVGNNRHCSRCSVRLHAVKIRDRWRIRKARNNYRAAIRTFQLRIVAVTFVRPRGVSNHPESDSDHGQMSSCAFGTRARQ